MKTKKKKISGTQRMELSYRRAVIEGVAPAVDDGRFPIKRTVGDKVTVTLDAYADGHDAIACVLRYRKLGNALWSEIPMVALGNDRWQAEFQVSELGQYEYTAEAWIDIFQTWRLEFEKRVQADQDIANALAVGAEHVTAAAARARGADAGRLKSIAKRLRAGDIREREALARSHDLAQLMRRYPDRSLATRYDKELRIVVDRERARFSSWYEFFPRSCTLRSGRHGTFKDCEALLPRIRAMGFDVVYLPPIHPVGHTHRKGKNNIEEAGPNDVGSPWGIGSHDGGHKAVHRELGTLSDFRRLVTRAREQDMEIALDIAFQCSPDHPYVTDHPQWFLQRPDGSIQYAENPPKKYQDIYPLYFETEDWRALWEELLSVVLFWIEQGVRIFRVDNPHTKPFAFWDYLINEVKQRHTDIIFLAEAFTRPKVMGRLAKLGFTQSYTYFTWRNTKQELSEYFTELTQTEMREYFRPNLWPNTPDILHAYLQDGGRPAFTIRLILAATLGANYGIYGPAFELCENKPREPGSEEYLNSEKYEIKTWDINRPDSLGKLITRVNRIRHEHPALQSDWSLRFHPIDNDMLLCYSKRSEDKNNVILVVVNLDTLHVQAGWTTLVLPALGIAQATSYEVHDLLTDTRYQWQGSRNYIELNPERPAHIFYVRLTSKGRAADVA